ncbi:DNA-methyltransferase [Rhizosphaericola mali]|uniref:Methyltransferase n=1 Tax=Rhizosphaericola mali TaxID=2545455 RepID=A0A5P2FZ88_9BACT|nr:site-specific DNA-methyltransferase [Rhizosphaericola mali]QES88864.1 site-specific DNA-methyltransferase [Rhizosphaericola mali]
MIQLFNENNTDTLSRLQDESVDIILTDPPYLYLKGQKLERPFDENKFFSECKRVLTKDGFIVLFGRGESFYRWNTILADMGFKFKEEIVWDKLYTSSPMMALSRKHETISIFTKDSGVINKVKVSYIESRLHDEDSIIKDLKKVKTVLSNRKTLEAVEDYLTKGQLTYDGDYVSSTTITNGKRRVNRVVAVINAMEVGMNEKSIIKQVRDHYSAIHPTQKPVRLLERLLALVLPKKERENITVVDPFGGSFSTMEACINMGVNGISCEIDKEYFEDGKERIETKLKEVKQISLFKTS